jgi:hypothetical protein
MQFAVSLLRQEKRDSAEIHTPPQSCSCSTSLRRRSIARWCQQIQPMLPYAVAIRGGYEEALLKDDLRRDLSCRTKSSALA